jgi:hypothetical protein
MFFGVMAQQNMKIISKLEWYNLVQEMCANLP